MIKSWTEDRKLWWILSSDICRYIYEHFIRALHMKPDKERIRLENFTVPSTNFNLFKELLTHLTHIYSTLFPKKVKILCWPTCESTCQKRTATSKQKSI